MKQKSDLPFGSEFSPSQIELPELLVLAQIHSGNVAALQEAIQSKFFAQHGGGSPKNQKTLAMNCRLGMKAYGVIDENATLTDFGNQLLVLKGDPRKLYEALARHILLNLHGMRLIQCIREMTAAGEEVNLTTLRSGLAERVIHYPPGGKHPSMMRLWLHKAGIFPGDRWQTDDTKLTAVLGTPSDDFAVLEGFTPEQRAFLRALANTGLTTPQPANEIARLVSATYGVHFPEKSLPKLVLNALVATGYIKATKTTKGRGAKPFLFSPTEKLKSDIIEPFFSQIKDQFDAPVHRLLKKPVSGQ